jgi:hypothetical protein
LIPDVRWDGTRGKVDFLADDLDRELREVAGGRAAPTPTGL